MKETNVQNKLDTSHGHEFSVWFFFDSLCKGSTMIRTGVSG